MDLSIVLPGIRRQNWEALYNSAYEAAPDLDWEMIIVGPGHYPEFMRGKPNFRFISDWGPPARCAQIGVLAAEGVYMTWASDDGVFIPLGLQKAWEVLDNKAFEDGVIMRYREGGNSQTGEYWNAWTHADLRLPGVKNHYKIAPVAMYETEFFMCMGGWDCRFEHLNMCCHDLAFRVQNVGGRFYESPIEILDCTWDVHCEEYQPVRRAYLETDLPLWNQMYGEKDPERKEIDYNNWLDCYPVWEKRFGATN